MILALVSSGISFLRAASVGLALSFLCSAVEEIWARERSLKKREANFSPLTFFLVSSLPRTPPPKKKKKKKNTTQQRTRARFLLTSTSEVYGDPLEHPQTEAYWGNVNPIGERSCYDEGKRAAECLTFDYRREHGLDVRVCRIFNTYGPRMALDDGRVVSNFVAQALTNQPMTVYGDGQQTRSFQYVSDLVAGMVAVMEGKEDFLCSFFPRCFLLSLRVSDVFFLISGLRLSSVGVLLARPLFGRRGKEVVKNTKKKVTQPQNNIFF